MRHGLFLKPNIQRVWWSLLLFVTSARLTLAWLVPLQGTEAYYWLWSKHLALGYYDHPPLVAWTIRVSTLLFGESELAIRLPSVLGMTGAAVIVWWLGREIGGYRAGCRAGIAALVLPYFTFMSVTAFPDGVMMFFCALGVVFVYQKKTLWAGFSLGVAFLAKLPVAALGLGTVLYLRRQPRELLKLLLAGCLAASPFFYWNWQNDWATFLFQFGSRQAQESHTNWLGPIDFLLIQCAAVSPILLGALIYASLSSLGVSSDLTNFLRAHTLVPLGLFSLASLQHKIMPHWPLLAYLTALVALGLQSRNSSRLWKYSCLGGASLSLVLLGVGLNPSLLHKLTDPQNGGSLTEPYAMESLAQHLKGSKEPVITENHGLTATLEYALGRKVFWYSRNLHGRQFLFWDDYERLAGLDFTFVDTSDLNERPDVKEMLQDSFSSVGPTEIFRASYAGRTAQTFYLTRCTGFKGFEP